MKIKCSNLRTNSLWILVSHSTEAFRNKRNKKLLLKLSWSPRLDLISKVKRTDVGNFCDLLKKI